MLTAGRPRAGGLSQRNRLMRGKSHRDAGFVPGRTLQAFERHFEHQAEIVVRAPPRAPARSGRRCCRARSVDLCKLLIGEAEIGLADRHEFVAVVARVPDPEGVVRIERRALAVAALRIHQHGVDRSNGSRFHFHHGPFGRPGT